MNYSRFIIVLTAFFLLNIGKGNLYAQEKSTLWSLEECIAHALKHNISIKDAQLDLELMEVDVLQAKSNYLPSVNGQATNSWNTGLTQNITTGILQTQTTRNLSLGVTAGVDLFKGLVNLRQLQRAKLSQLSSQYSLDKMENDIALFVINAYLEVLINKQTLAVLTEQNNVTLSQYKRTQDLIDAGTLPQGDILEIEATNADEQQQIINAENNIRIALINLAQLLRIENYSSFDIPDQTYEVPMALILEKTPQEIIERAKQNRYEIKIAESNVAVAEKDIALAKGNYWPSLQAFFNYNTRESGANQILQSGINPAQPTMPIGVVETTGQTVVAPNYLVEEVSPKPFFDQLSLNDGISYGVQLNVPIFNGFSTRNSVKRSKINAERAKYKLEQATLDLESDIYQAYVDAQGAAKSFEAATKAVKAQQQAYQYAKDRYDVGLINAFDFSQSKFRLTNAESNLIRAKFDYIFKLKLLELYFGINPEDIQL